MGKVTADLSGFERALRQDGLCPDTGKCHHGCGVADPLGIAVPCWRKSSGCVPLSISGLNDQWELEVDVGDHGQVASVVDEQVFSMEFMADVYDTSTGHLVLGLSGTGHAVQIGSRWPASDSFDAIRAALRDGGVEVCVQIKRVAARKAG
jgi:hypothetical protein